MNGHILVLVRQLPRQTASATPSKEGESDGAELSDKLFVSDLAIQNQKNVNNATFPYT